MSRSCGVRRLHVSVPVIGHGEDHKYQSQEQARAGKKKQSVLVFGLMVGLAGGLYRYGNVASIGNHSQTKEVLLDSQPPHFKPARPIGVWGACFDQGQPHTGVGEAPQVMREAGLLKRLNALGCSVTDHGDITALRGEDQSPPTRQKEVAKFNQTTHNMVKQILDQGHIALTLGGDHSIGLGTVAGHLSSDPDCVVIWVDAHADINTISTSNSGNMHGMPVSFNIKQLQVIILSLRV